MTAVDRPDNGQDELDAVVQTIADMYRDPEVARYAMNDLRDWLSGDREAPSTAVRAALRAANLPLASARAGAWEQQREQVDAQPSPVVLVPDMPVRKLISAAILQHWRTPTSGCDCGQMRLGQSYSDHVADELLALLGGPQPDEEPEPCPVYSHGESGWHCAVTGDHDQHTNAAGTETW